MAVLGSENVHYKLQLKTRKSGTVLSAAMIVFEAHLRFQKDWAEVSLECNGPFLFFFLSFFLFCSFVSLFYLDNKRVTTFMQYSIHSYCFFFNVVEGPYADHILIHQG